jgi:hypothetical protein
MKQPISKMFTEVVLFMASSIEKRMQIYSNACQNKQWNKQLSKKIKHYEMKKITFTLIIMTLLFCFKSFSQDFETFIGSETFNSYSNLESEFNYNYSWGQFHNGTAKMIGSSTDHSHVWLDNGVLTIKATKEQTGEFVPDYRYPVNYYSGAIHSKKTIVVDANYPEWFVSGEFQAPVNVGTWPAFWLTSNWPPELDILEFKGSNFNNQNTYDGGWESQLTSVPTANSEWHSYSCYISKKNETDFDVHYYIDGIWKAVHTATNGVGRPMQLIINMQMEGSSGATGSGPSSDTYYKARNVYITRKPGNIFSGYPVPGIVQAENYTSMMGIQTETTSDAGAGLNVGWVDTGDWMTYTVTVAQAGTYSANFRVAGWSATGIISLQNSANIVLTSANVPNGGAGSYQKWSTIAGQNNFTLAPGKQTIRLFATNSPWNLNWFEIKQVVKPVLKTIEVTPTSTSIVEGQTKQFTATGKDQNGNVIAFTPTWSVNGGGTVNTLSGLFNATTSGGPYTIKASSGSVVGNASVTVTTQQTRYPIPGIIQTENYTNMLGIQTENTTDTGGGLDVGYTESGDWMDYAVNVQTAGVYTVSFRVASLVTTGSIQLRNSTGTTLATLAQGSTGGWQTWVTSNVTANLAAGNQTLRIYYTGAGLNLNWVQFTKVNNPPTVSLTAPANYTSVYVNTAVTVSANAADADGTVSKVEFYAGTTLIGTDTSSPYSISWTPTTAGTYAITSKATDNGGANATSPSVSLTATASTTTVTLNPTADAYVRGGTYAAANFGTTADLYVKTAPETDGLYTRKAYLKYSVAGMTGVQNAVVRLYAGTAAAFSVKVNETTDAWTETAINWNNAPVAGTLIATTAITAAGVYYEWNVTSYVQSQAAGDGIVSLVFSDAATTNAQIIFSSKEATANKPQLVVTSGTKSAFVNSDIQEVTNKELTIYPNPVSDELQIQNADRNSTVEVFNISGKLVMVEKTVTANNTLNVSCLKSGLYILKATGNNKTQLIRFIKK